MNKEHYKGNKNRHLDGYRANAYTNMIITPDRQTANSIVDYELMYKWEIDFSRTCSLALCET
jgi:hypothetical protein